MQSSSASLSYFSILSYFVASNSQALFFKLFRFTLTGASQNNLKVCEKSVDDHSMIIYCEINIS